MALILCSNPLITPLLPSSSSSSSVNATPCISRLQTQPIALYPKIFHGVRLQMPLLVKKATSFVVKASSDIDGTSPVDSNEPPSDSKKEVVPVDKLPLESKLQERMEQKMKMKLAKKIRLKRKRLVRKRQLRKKGRWPPSKMKKLKNV